MQMSESALLAQFDDSLRHTFLNELTRVKQECISLTRIFESFEMSHEDLDMCVSVESIRHEWLSQCYMIRRSESIDSL